MPSKREGKEMMSCCANGICDEHYFKLVELTKKHGSYVPPKHQLNWAIANMSVWQRVYGQLYTHNSQYPNVGGKK